MDNLIKRILLVTYLSKYNIKEIYHALTYEKFSDYLSYFLFNNQNLTEKYVIEVNKLSVEKYEEMKYLGIKFLPVFSENFPPLLRKIDQCPPLLFYKGAEIPKKEMIAMVGSRSVTEEADKTIDFFLDGLSDSNGIVSGLAKGVDTLAHQKSLSRGMYNIAVTANPLDSIYPSENYKLANRILDNGGTILSELSLGINRGKKSFVERNRIQSGLSSFVIPIEMGVKSGTMHTIDFCVRQKKHVIYKSPTEYQRTLEQYSGIVALKNKISLSKTSVSGYFNLSEIKRDLEKRNPTLFD